mgnify:FL=1
MSFKKDNKGFTLVELLVAMSIFIVFLGVLMSSYTSIIRAQREANDYRVMYSEARHVFETITQELRNGMVDYGKYCELISAGTLLVPAQDHIFIVNKDSLDHREISFDEGNGKIKYGIYDSGVYEDLNSEAVSVKNLEFHIYPYGDPYNDEYVMIDAVQFQPMVTVLATFERERSSQEPFSLTLQTTISSRIYDQIYEPSIACNQ